MKRSRENTKSSLHLLSEEVSTAIGSTGVDQVQFLRACLSKAAGLSAVAICENDVGDVTRQQISRIFRILVLKAKFSQDESLSFLRGVLLPQACGIDVEVDHALLSAFAGDIAYFLQSYSFPECSLTVLRYVRVVAEEVGSGCTEIARSNLLRITMSLLPLLRTSGRGAADLFKVLRIFDLSPGDLWRWFLAVLGEEAMLQNDEAMTIWEGLWRVRWEVALEETLAVCLRVLKCSDANLKVLLAAVVPEAFLKHCAEHSLGESVLKYFEGTRVDDVIRNYLLCECRTFALVPKYFPTAKSVTDAIEQSDGLTAARRVELALWVGAHYGGHIPTSTAVHLANSLSGYRPSKKEAWWIAQLSMICSTENDGLRLLNSVEFTPELLPATCHWKCDRAATWAQDIDGLFSTPDPTVLKEALGKLGSYVDPGQILAAFARSKRRFNPEHFVLGLECIAGMKHSPETLTSITSSSGIDSRAAALTLWYNGSESSWDRLILGGAADGEERGVWAFAAAARLHDIPFADLGMWTSDVTSLVFESLHRVSKPYTTYLVDNVEQLSAQHSLVNPLAGCGVKQPSTLNSAPEDGILKDILNALATAKRPSQFAGLGSALERHGVGLAHVPKLLGRLRVQMMLEILQLPEFTPDLLTTAVGLSMCEGEPRGWSQELKKSTGKAQSHLSQAAFEILDKFGEGLVKATGTLALLRVMRGVRNFILALGSSGQNAVSKIQGLLHAKGDNYRLHSMIMEGQAGLIRTLSPEALGSNVDVIAADMLELLRNIRHPDTFREWSRVMGELHSKSPKAKVWTVILTPYTLGQPILSSLPGTRARPRESLEACISLLGSAAHSFRRVVLRALLAHLRGFTPLQRTEELRPHAAPLVRTVLECIQVPLLSSLTAELVGVIGSLGAIRAQLTVLRPIEEVIDEALDWRKFVHTTLSQHCPNAIDAVATASAHDQIAFVIQEVIQAACEQERLHNGKAGPVTRSELEGYVWWADLPCVQRDKYQIFLSTKFSVLPSGDADLSPIFTAGMSVTAWCRQLSKALSCQADMPFRRFFKATRALAVADRGRMLALLPVFVLTAILTSPDAGVFVANEIKLACQGGSREVVMVAMTLVEAIHRSATRIALSQRLSKFKLKDVEAFPYSGRVGSAMDSLDCEAIVRASVRFGFDAHAIRLLEGARTLPSIGSLSSDQVLALKHAFKNLHDPDSVKAIRELAPPGVATCEDLELENDYEGAMRLASASGASRTAVDLSTSLRFADCAARTGHAGSALACLETVSPRNTEVQLRLNEAGWRLGRWDIIAECEFPSFGPPLKALFSGRSSFVAPEVARVAPIIASTAGHTDSLPDDFMVILSGLEDLRFVELNTKSASLQYLGERMSSAWEFRRPEPLQQLHCALYAYLEDSGGLRELWIGQARHSKLLEDFPSAIAAARRVGALGSVDIYHSEMASILAKMGRKSEAVQFAIHSISAVSNVCGSHLKAQAAMWGEELNFYTPNQTRAMLEEAVKQDAPHESYELLGLFHYKMFSLARSNVEASTSQLKSKEMYQAMESHVLPGMTAFVKALSMNSRHMMEAMPRLVTMWLDGNATLYQTLKEGRLRGVDPERITSETSSVAGKVPVAFFLASVSHLLSRLVTTETASAVANLLVRLTHAYPQQMAWQLLAAGLSAPTARASIIQNKVLGPCTEHGQTKDILVHFKALFSCLTHICRSTIPGNKLSGFEPVKKLASHLNAAKFVIPTIKSLHPSYSNSKGSFFFHTAPFIHSFGDQVDVINSLQKPKRVVVIDSGGRSHFYLMKAKDDPRKDIRMMEIATHLNNVFLKGAASTTEALSLQCYAVMALCDDCALIEWVDGTATIRRILDEAYVIDGTGVKISEVQGWKEACDKGRFSKVELFTKYIFPAAQPVLHQWFQRSFPHTLQWYRARNLYTQSCAVWSMCGHIVGLGDRHAENLLISLESGQAMHVDFACMFDKGETLRVPETVRFRLTQNVVDGFGITGSSGPFTNCCERALSVLGDNKDVVEGVLETFIYDPLLEWAGKEARADPKGLIRRCKRRLDGYTDFYGAAREEAPLSVSGQVRALINHNTKLEVLSDMYIWWMVWL